MKLARFVSVLAVALLMSSVAFAQDGSNAITNDKFGVEITPPEKWEVTEGNEKAVANFKHRGSQSQIELRVRALGGHAQRCRLRISQ